MVYNGIDESASFGVHFFIGRLCIVVRSAIALISEGGTRQQQRRVSD